MTSARLIIDPPMPGNWNMALDQALLETADRRGEITLRFYRWSEPTLSLGYFQKYADRGNHAASRDCAIVRRSSGGGAIVHDRELTYSICVPESNRWSKSSDQLYDLVHHQVVHVLDLHGISARLFDAAKNEQDQRTSHDNQSFLCFQRRSRGDVVVADSKVCGSAQRRLRNALIQHGSLILGTSSCAPELSGLAELTGTTLNYEKTCRNLADGISASLQINLTDGTATESELNAAKRIRQERFCNDAWTRKR
jgi:lipoate-protein ligase A